MRLPPLRTVFLEGRETFRRFPVVIVVAAVGTVAAMLLMGRTEPDEGLLYQAATRLLLTACLGIPLLTALTVVSERAGFAPRLRALVMAGAVVYLIVYYLFLPAQVTNAPIEYLIRWMALFAGLHLLVSFAPFARRDEISQFWEYNKILFLRLLTGGLFTFVLWAGLSVALVAVEKLFAVHVPGQRYGQLFAFLVGILNTWFLLAGVPRDVAHLDAERAYPKGLRIFAQYVLIPLDVIYLVILYVYAAKILVEWDWPKGWVGNLVLGFSLSGMLAALLVHPIAARSENTVIRLFARYYYMALLPMTVLLFLAIYRRIAEYGITEPRYYVLVLSFWLAGMVLFFIFSRTKSIKIVPISLCTLALLSTIGPWSAQNVTVWSQRQRLEGLLLKNGLLQGGQVLKASASVPFEDARQISSIIRHFTTVNGLGPLESLFGARLDTLLASPDAKPLTPPRQAARVTDMLGVRYVEAWDAASQSFHTLGASALGTVPVQGFDRMIRLSIPASLEEAPTIAMGDETWGLRFDRPRQTLTITKPAAGGDSVVFHLTPFVQKTLRDESLMAQPERIPPEQLVLDGLSRTMKLRLAFNRIVLDNRSDSALFSSGAATLLIGSVETAAAPGTETPNP